MPNIYQARCEHCEYASRIFPAFYGAVWVDTPDADRLKTIVAGAVILEPSQQHELAEQTHPNLVVLGHPSESYHLASTGYSWFSVGLAGRYVHVNNVICRDCGELYDVRKLTCPLLFGSRIGCVFGMILGIWFGIDSNSFCIGVSLVYFITTLCMIGLWIPGLIYTRIRFRERAKEISHPNHCPKCQSDRYVLAVNGANLPCPKCSNRTMNVHIAGMS